MKIKIDIGYKFIFGFMAVVATAAIAPNLVDRIGMPEWLRGVVTFLTAIVIGLIFGSFFTRGFSRDFRELTKMADDISRGDLTHPGRLHLQKIFRDEISELAEALERMLKDLKTLVGHIHDSSASLADASEGLHGVVTTGRETAVDLASSTSRIFAGATTQAEHLDATTKIIKDMTLSADEVKVQARDTALSASKASRIVEEGVSAASSALEKIETTFQGIDESKGMMLKLGERVNDIPKILDVTTHISRQIDLLALNAAIEASKAGEHGKGFAMVADEVRRLSERTNKSIAEIGAVVKDIKDEVDRVVAAFIHSTSFATEGRTDINRIREFLKGINAFTNDIAEKVDSILSLSQRQSEGAVNAVNAIESAASVAKDNVSATKEADSAVETHRASINSVFESAERLKELSHKLKDIVDGFKIVKKPDDNEPIIHLPDSMVGDADDKSWS